MSFDISNIYINFAPMKQEIDLKKIIGSSKELGIENDFKNPYLRIYFEIICAVLCNLNVCGHIGTEFFKNRVLSKRDNPIEYYKALINFAQY